MFHKKLERVLEALWLENGELLDDVETLTDRLDDLECEVRQNKRVQDLVNKGLEGWYDECARKLEQLAQREKDVRSERQDQRGTIFWTVTAPPYSDNLQDLSESKRNTSSEAGKKRRGRPKKTA